MATNREWENPAIQHRNRLQGRTDLTSYDTPEKALARVKTSSGLYLRLDGDWQFTLKENPYAVPDGFASPEYQEGEEWKPIRVPGCWQMQGYGTPVYSASPYLFATDPPYVSEDNATGLYRTVFTLPESFLGQRVILRFEGVASMFTVYVNGQEIGMSKGAHMTAEFDVTDAVKAGENLLAVKVYRFSDGSYLEIQDMLHMSGIFRPVTLHAMPFEGIYDVIVHADMYGHLSGRVVCGEGTEPAAVLYDKTGMKVMEASGKEFSMDLPDARLWSAEDPYLYTLVVGVEGQYVPVRVGFRSVSTVDRAFCVNGKPIKAKGVNHHDTNTELGWAVSEEAMLKDILLMKRHNINFVRTSHYPSPAFFYDLADEYGIYLMSEADIECHGMGITDVSTLSRDPAWEYAYVDRASRMVYRDRNHPAVLMWSMGNESGFGENFRRVSAAMKALDDRPVHYCGAKDVPSYIPEEIQKDPEKMYQMMKERMNAPTDPCVDFESMMYMPPSGLEGFGQREDPRPFILCEYAHSMGNGPGSLKDYWDVIYKYPKILGACVWEWQDHGVLKYTEDGGKYYACGNELLMPYKRDGINGNFCNDGLLSPEKVPHPGLVELKKVLQPLKITLASENPVTVRIESRYQFVTGELYGKYVVKTEEKVLFEGDIDIDDLLPGGVKEITLPSASVDGEAFYDLSFCLKEDKNYAEKGYEVAAEQFVFGAFRAPELKSPETPEKALKTVKNGMEAVVEGEGFAVTFDLLHGSITSYRAEGEELLTAPTRQCFFRAPTDNDVGIVGPTRPGAANNWKDNGLDRLVPRNIDEPVITEKEGSVEVRFLQRFGASPFPSVFDIETIYKVLPDGTLETKAHYEVLETPYINDKFFFARFGFEFRVKKEFSKVRFFGRGPQENYSDRCTAANVGWYEKKVQEMHTGYSRMQENGARTDVRRLSVADETGKGVYFEAVSQPFTFTAHDYTVEALTKAWHEYQLERSGDTVLNIDMVQCGLGSNSCGPEPLDAYKPDLRKDNDFTFRFRPF